MDFVFICRNGEENSVLTNVAMAMDAVKGGQSAAVLFTEDALAGLAGHSMEWAPMFKDRSGRTLVSRQATARGYPLAAEKDARWTDVSRLLDAAKAAGVALWADSLWTGFLGMDGKADGTQPTRQARPNETTFRITALPGAVKTLAAGETLAELKSAKTVVGGF